MHKLTHIHTGLSVVGYYQIMNKVLNYPVGTSQYFDSMTDELTHTVNDRTDMSIGCAVYAMHRQGYVQADSQSV